LLLLITGAAVRAFSADQSRPTPAVVQTTPIGGSRMDAQAT